MVFVFTPHPLYSHHVLSIHVQLPPFTINLPCDITSLDFPSHANIYSSFFFLEASLHGSMVPLLSSEVEFPGCFFDGCFYKNGILHTSVLGLGK